MEDRNIQIDDTKLIWKTNFAGDPARGYRGSTQRTFSIIVPPERVNEFIAKGANVKSTNPREGEEEGYIPKYYVNCVVSYHPPFEWQTPSVVHFWSGENHTELGEDAVGVLDGIAVESISGVFSASKGGTLYVAFLKVVQDLNPPVNIRIDPYA